MPPSPRLTAHHALATALGRLGDRELAELVATGVPLGTGVGGEVLRVEVTGRPVFVKRVRRNARLSCAPAPRVCAPRGSRTRPPLSWSATRGWPM
ncbi:hypothetical protein AB0N31_12735 [Streptomyces sp. NPDC051051]|uniref:hypothetical protein n=1 Tax=Streptomyces sp. NPDC051051 TaxID=3155666 RepID=UPI00342C29A1